MLIKSKKIQKTVPIEFVSKVSGFETFSNTKPQPSSRFMPPWWKNMPLNSHQNLSSSYFEEHPITVKGCPSFPDYLSRGYILPMWADTVLVYSKETDQWRAKWGDSSSDHGYNVDSHPNSQFHDYVDVNSQGVPGSFTFKLNSPWSVFTPKGYSVLQLPLFYHFNKEFSALPGVIHTDILHNINLQVTYFGEGKEIFIPQGTPLAQYIPFKRDIDYKLVVREATPEDLLSISKMKTLLRSTFVGNGSYRKTKNQYESN